MSPWIRWKSQEVLASTLDEVITTPRDEVYRSLASSTRTSNYCISTCKNEKRQARPWLIENEKKLEVTAPSKCVLKLSWSCHDILRLKSLLAKISPLVPKPSLPPPKNILWLVQLIGWSFHLGNIQSIGYHNRAKKAFISTPPLRSGSCFFFPSSSFNITL